MADPSCFTNPEANSALFLHSVVLGRGSRGRAEPSTTGFGIDGVGSAELAATTGFGRASAGMAGPSCFTNPTANSALFFQSITAGTADRGIAEPVKMAVGLASTGRADPPMRLLGRASMGIAEPCMIAFGLASPGSAGPVTMAFGTTEPGSAEPPIELAAERVDGRVATVPTFEVVVSARQARAMAAPARMASPDAASKNKLISLPPL